MEEQCTHVLKFSTTDPSLSPSLKGPLSQGPILTMHERPVKLTAQANMPQQYAYGTCGVNCEARLSLGSTNPDVLAKDSQMWLSTVSANSGFLLHILCMFTFQVLVYLCISLVCYLILPLCYIFRAKYCNCTLLHLLDHLVILLISCFEF